jgi:replicative DNA helicase
MENQMEEEEILNDSNSSAREEARRSSAISEILNSSAPLKRDEKALLSCLFEDPKLLARHSRNIQPQMFTDPVSTAMYVAMTQIQERGGLDFKVKEVAQCMSELSASLPARDKLESMIDRIITTEKDPNFYRISQNFWENWRRREMNRQLKSSLSDPNINTNQELLLERYAEIVELKEKPNPFAGICLPASETIGSTWNLLEDIWSGKLVFPQVRTGIDSIDNLTAGGFNEGSFVVLGAATGHGKTAAGINISCSMANIGIKVAYISMEEQVRDLMLRVLGSQSGVPIKHLKSDYCTSEEKRRAKEVFTRYSTDDSLLQFYCGARSPEQIIEMIRLHHDRDETKVFFVDYIQRLKPSDDNMGSLTMQVARLSMALGELARELDIVIIATSQLQRTLRKEMGQGKRKPSTYDLSESNFLECEASYIFTLYRQDHILSEFPEFEDHDMYNPDDRSTIEFILCKHRHGPTGSTKVHFDGRSLQITERHEQMGDDFDDLDSNPFA